MLVGSSAFSTSESEDGDDSVADSMPLAILLLVSSLCLVGRLLSVYGEPQKLENIYNYPLLERPG